MNNQKCHKCGANLKCSAGCSAHPANWYCPQCALIKELQAEWVTVPRKMTKEMKKSSGIWQDPWDLALAAAPKPVNELARLKRQIRLLPRRRSATGPLMVRWNDLAALLKERDDG